MPPTPIAGTRKEVGIEPKAVQSTVMRIPQIEEVTGQCVLSTNTALISLPSGQFENSVAEGPEVLIRCGEGYPWRGNDDD